MAEDAAGCDKDIRLVQGAFGEFFRVSQRIGDASPKEEPGLGAIKAATEGLHDAFGQRSPFGVASHVVFAVPIFVVVHGSCGRQLHGAEGARVDIGLHFQYPRDEFRVRRQHSHAPPGHVVALGHRIEFDAAVFRSVDRQNREVFALIENEGIGVVVHHHQVSSLRKVHQALVGFATGACSRRHVRVVAPEQSHTRGVHRLQFVEIRLPPALRPEIVGHRLRTEQARKRRVGGIAGIGHQNLISVVDKSQRGVEDALFRTDERLDLASRIELNTKPPLIEASHGFAQLRRAYGGLVGVSGRFVCCATKRFDGGRRGREVRATNGQAHDVVAGGSEASHLFELAREVVFLNLGKASGGMDVDVHGRGEFLVTGVFT